MNDWIRKIAAIQTLESNPEAATMTGTLGPQKIRAGLSADWSPLARLRQL
jgi:hypothetical protein